MSLSEKNGCHPDLASSFRVSAACLAVAQKSAKANQGSKSSQNSENIRNPVLFSLSDDPHNAKGFSLGGRSEFPLELNAINRRLTG